MRAVDQPPAGIDLGEPGEQIHGLGEMVGRPRDQLERPQQARVRRRAEQRVDAGGVHAADVDVHADQVAGEAAREAEVQRVAGAQRREARHHRAAQAQALAVVLVPAAAAGQARAQRRLDEVQLLVGHEDDLLLALSAFGAHLGTRGDADRFRRRCGEREQQVGAGRRGGEQLDADQFQELHVQPVGYLVDPVQDHLGHPGEQLDERHARIGDVVVCPLWTVPGDPALRLVDDVLEAPVVKVGCGQAHAGSSVLLAGMRCGPP